MRMWLVTFDTSTRGDMNIVATQFILCVTTTLYYSFRRLFIVSLFLVPALYYSFLLYFILLAFALRRTPFIIHRSSRHRWIHCVVSFNVIFCLFFCLSWGLGSRHSCTVLCCRWLMLPQTSHELICTCRCCCRCWTTIQCQSFWFVLVLAIAARPHIYLFYF